MYINKSNFEKWKKAIKKIQVLVCFSSCFRFMPLCVFLLLEKR